MAERTPVTVLTGFLGAGKTTLLNQLLRQPALAQTAVLVNEFGEIGLDHLLVEKLDDTTVLLNAGCLCCTIRGDLSRVLRELLPRARRDEITRIVIETTGLADPIPILITLMTDPVAASAYRLDGVVTVVDAVNGMLQLDTHKEAVRQVAVADRIIISKADLAIATTAGEDVSPSAVEKLPAGLRARLHKLNPDAPVTQATNGQIDAAFILDAGLFNPASKISDVTGWLKQNESSHGDGHHHDPNRHAAGIATFSVVLDQPVAWLKLSTWLNALVSRYGARILRVKGILDLTDCNRPVAIHAVGHLLHPPITLVDWPTGAPRSSRIVFIVQDVERADILDRLDEIRLPSQPPVAQVKG